MAVTVSADIEVQRESPFENRTFGITAPWVRHAASGYIYNGFLYTWYSATESERGQYMCINKTALATAGSWEKQGGGDEFDLANYYTKTETDALVAAVATALKDGVAADGDTLLKLRALISTVAGSVTTNASQIAAIQALLSSSDVNLDTLQEIVTFIQEHETDINSLLSGKLDKTAKATEAEANAETDDTKYITSLRLGTWLTSVIGRGLTWASKQIFTTAPRFSSVTASQYLKVDGTKDLTSVAAIPATDVTEDATHRFATDAEKGTWNGKQDALSIASDAEMQAGTDNVKRLTPLRATTWWTWLKTQVATISAVWNFTSRPTYNGNAIATLVETFSLTPAQVAALPNGSVSVATVNKSIDGSAITYEAGIELMDEFASGSLDTLLSDTANWGNVSGRNGDYLQLNGTNTQAAGYPLGRSNQKKYINSIFYACISNTDIGAIWVRNKSIDVETSSTVITDIKSETGWSLNRKTSTVKSKVGNWYAETTGYYYACYGDNGVNPTAWYWLRIGEPSVLSVDITDATLIAEIQAHDFVRTPSLTPAASVKGSDMQRHVWIVNGIYQMAYCINKGTAKWVKMDIRPNVKRDYSSNLNSNATVTFTTPNDGYLHIYCLGAFINLYSISGTLQVRVGYKDEQNVSKSTLLSASFTAAGQYAIATQTIVCYHNTTITLEANQTGTNNYFFTGFIEDKGILVAV